jgi:membrane protease YdiL (CAAX protease family)
LSSSQKDNDTRFDLKNTLIVVLQQSSLIVIALAIAAFLQVPALGPGVNFSREAVTKGTLATLPLGFLACALDLVEVRFPAIQDVTKASQRFVLNLLGTTWKPVTSLVVATLLGLAAGFGEEMLFRGILQTELSSQQGNAVGIIVSSIIFGALHAVTPLYAFLATLASVYFGWLYVSSDNVAVPIVCHAIYDMIALLYAHFTVSRLSAKEQKALEEWNGPGGSASDLL